MTDWSKFSPPQPAPTPTSSTPIYELVRNDVQDRRLEDLIDARAKVGLQNYGVYLQAGNGRDAMRDAFEELIDLVMYLRQAMEEGQDVSELYWQSIGMLRDFHRRLR